MKSPPSGWPGVSRAIRHFESLLKIFKAPGITYVRLWPGTAASLRLEGTAYRKSERGFRFKIIQASRILQKRRQLIQNWVITLRWIDQAKLIRVSTLHE